MIDAHVTATQMAEALNENTFALETGETTHECAKYDESRADLKTEDLQSEEAILGTMVWFAPSKRWWISNGIYTSPIYFCPYCGLELSKLKRT